MKIFKTFLIAMVMVAFASCDKGSGSGFNPDVCEKLADLIEDGEDLNEDEFSQMLNQIEAMVNIASNKVDEFDGDRIKYKKYEHSKEGKEISLYNGMFITYIYAHEEDMTKSQRKQWKAIMRKITMMYDALRDSYYDSYYDNYYDNYYDRGYASEPYYDEPCYEAPAEAAKEAAAEEATETVWY